MARKGIPNKTSLRAEVTCGLRKFSSIDNLIDASKIALEKFIEHSEKESNGSISLMESQAAEYLKIYVKINLDIASYIHPKRKAIEVSAPDPTQDMTPQQRLEAMKSAVAMLELKLKEQSNAIPG